MGPGILNPSSLFLVMTKYMIVPAFAQVFAHSDELYIPYLILFGQFFRPQRQKTNRTALGSSK